MGLTRGFVSVAAAIALFPCLGCPAAGGAEQAPLVGWKALNGKVTLASHSGAQMLEWGYEYSKAPSVITRSADAGWKRAAEIAFQVRSNREGKLFLRLDQSDKKTFAASFDVGRTWRQVTLSMGDFLPAGQKEGQVEAALLSNAYLVDLNGSDQGARGTRTVWCKGMTLRDAPSGGGGGLVPLAAFDADGNILDLEQIVRRGTSGGRWCFLTGAEGNAVPMRIFPRSVTVDGRAANIPVLVTEEKRPVTLEVLYWPVGNEFKLWLQADLGGAGRSLDRGVLLLNLALARTRYRKLLAYLGRDGGVFGEAIRQAGETLKKAEREPTLRARAAAADRVLEKLLKISRDAVRTASLAAVRSRTEPGPDIAVPAPKAGVLAPGIRATVQLVAPAFYIGMGQGFGFVTKREPAEKVDAYYAELRKLGFNMVTMPLYWDQVIDRTGRYTSWRDRLRFDRLAELGYAIHAHGFVQSGMPDDVKRLKGEDFTRAARNNISRLARDYSQKYGSSIVLWQAINEPASNAFGGSSMGERVRMVSDLIGHMRAVVPGAKVVVNDYDWERGVEADRPFASKSITGSLQFYRELLRAQNKPDVLSLEWYPGARVDRPEFKVNMAEPCMDLLDASRTWDRFIALGRPLAFTESNFPGSMKEEDRNGYAWGRWDAASQARAAVDTFHLAMSKPQIVGWAWWSITDDEPWQPNGGLFTAKGQRKPVLDALAKAIAALKSPKEVMVKTAGRLGLPRMAGTYRINIPGGVAWTVVRDAAGKVSLGKASRE